MTNVAMATVCALSPLLFVTFKNELNISYTLLGFLVVINFCTQLAVDLMFTFAPSVFNIKTSIRIMPVLTVIGLLVYSFMPMAFPKYAYAWLVIGTVIFSASAGLCEVLISPLVAAIPSDNPERDMSKLHSSYAWGLVGIVIFGALYLGIFGSKYWNYLGLLFAIIPTVVFIMFLKSPLPDISIGGNEKGKKPKIFNAGLIMCFFCIFLGGATEVTMTQWISGYIESALGIPKVVGDILGMALFAVALGLGRTLYGKFGKNILNLMIAGMATSAMCYIVATLSPNSYVGLVACVLTGFCSSMLWPGNVILVGEKFPHVGVAAYALMAAGGDLGSSVAPQIVGVVADVVSEGGIGKVLSESLGLSAEQIGMRAGLLLAALFPLVGTLLAVIMKIYFKKKSCA